MITDLGKIEILRSLAGISGTPVGSIAVGVVDSAPSQADRRLGYEIYRAPIEVASIDQLNGQVIYKAVLPAETAGHIREIGVWSGGEIVDSSGLLLTFEPEFEEWSSGTWTTDNARIGEQGLTIDGSAELQGAMTDLTDLKPEDTIDILAYASANATTTVRFGNDPGNYIELTASIPAGYKVTSVPFGSASTVGSPDLSELSTITITTTAPVTFDGLRFSITNDYNNVLVARYLVDKVKTFDIPMEIEFKLDTSLGGSE